MTARGNNSELAATAGEANPGTTAGRPVGTKGMPRAQRESLILDAAVAEFGRLGYAGGSLATIAAQAGISKPMVISYFESKEGLYIACVRRAGDNLVERIDSVLAQAPITLQTAADTLATIFEGLEQRPHDWTVLTDRTTPPGSAARDAARHYRDLVTAQGTRGIAALIDDAGLDADDLSILTDVWANIVTAVVQWWLRHPDQDAAQMTQRSYRILGAFALAQKPR